MGIPLMPSSLLHYRDGLRPMSSSTTRRVRGLAVWQQLVMKWGRPLIIGKMDEPKLIASRSSGRRALVSKMLVDHFLLRFVDVISYFLNSSDLLFKKIDANCILIDFYLVRCRYPIYQCNQNTLFSIHLASIYFHIYSQSCTPTNVSWLYFELFGSERITFESNESSVFQT